MRTNGASSRPTPPEKQGAILRDKSLEAVVFVKSHRCIVFGVDHHRERGQA